MSDRREAYSRSRTTLLSSCDLNTVKSFSHYNLGDPLGRGAFGNVFRGLNTETGVVVAVKQIAKELVAPDKLPAITREIETLKSLSHVNIVKLLDFHETKLHLFLVLEYVEGGSLSALVKKFGCFNEKLLALYLRQILAGLVYLHESHVVHRDIKGANILITKEGTCKLADFGSCTIAAANRKLTVVGTPFWMAPEIISHSSDGGFGSDIWSLGCTIIELLTGVPPYWNLGANIALFRMVEDERPPLPETLSPELRHLLEIVFTKDVKTRPNAVELLEHAFVKNAWQGDLPSAQSLAGHLSEASGRSRSFSLEKLFLLSNSNSKKKPSSPRGTSKASSPCDTPVRKRSLDDPNIPMSMSVPIDIRRSGSDHLCEELGLSPRLNLHKEKKQFFRTFSFWKGQGKDPERKQEILGTKKESNEEHVSKSPPNSNGPSPRNKKLTKAQSEVLTPKSTRRTRMAKIRRSVLKKKDKTEDLISDEMASPAMSHEHHKQARRRGSSSSPVSNEVISNEAKQSPQAARYSASPTPNQRSGSPLLFSSSLSNSQKRLSRTISDKLSKRSPTLRRVEAEARGTPSRSRSPRDDEYKRLCITVERLVEAQIRMEEDIIVMKRVMSRCNCCGPLLTEWLNSPRSSVGSPRTDSEYSICSEDERAGSCGNLRSAQSISQPNLRNFQTPNTSINQGRGCRSLVRNISGISIGDGGLVEHEVDDIEDDYDKEQRTEVLLGLREPDTTLTRSLNRTDSVRDTLLHSNK